MATYETAHAVQDYAHYLIASEELEPAAGWDYTVLSEKLGFDGFYDEVLASFAARQGAKTYYTLSVTDLSQLSRVDEALDAIVNAVLEGDGANKLIFSYSGGNRLYYRKVEVGIAALQIKQKVL